MLAESTYHPEGLCRGFCCCWNWSYPVHWIKRARPVCLSCTIRASDVFLSNIPCPLLSGYALGWQSLCPCQKQSDYRQRLDKLYASMESGFLFYLGSSEKCPLGLIMEVCRQSGLWLAIPRDARYLWKSLTFSCSLKSKQAKHMGLQQGLSSLISPGNQHQKRCCPGDFSLTQIFCLCDYISMKAGIIK